MVLIGVIVIILVFVMRGLERSKALAWGYSAIADAEEPPVEPRGRAARGSAVS
jgi:hypothetical protein